MSIVEDNLPSDETYKIFLHLEILELRREVERLHHLNEEYKNYITNYICQEQLPKRTLSLTSREKLKFYHDMKDKVVSEEHLTDKTPWYIIKQKTDELWKSSKL